MRELAALTSILLHIFPVQKRPRDTLSGGDPRTVEVASVPAHMAEALDALSRLRLGLEDDAEPLGQHVPILILSGQLTLEARHTAS